MTARLKPLDVFERCRVIFKQLAESEAGLDAVARSLREWSVREPGSLAIRGLRADLLAGGGRYRDALEEYSWILEQGRPGVSVLAAKARCELALGQREAAARTLAVAQKLEPWRLELVPVERELGTTSE